MQAIDKPVCPLCNGKRIWKDGIRYTEDDKVQRYICRECGHRFSETSAYKSDSPEHVQRVHTKKSNSSYAFTLGRQVGVALAEGTKNLVKVETRTEKQAAEATEKITKADVKGKIVEFAWHLKKEGYQETTSKQYVTVIKTLVNKGANIFDPESVKDLIAKQHWSGARKHVVVSAYTSFLKLLAKTWTKPMYHVTRKFPFIPTEQEIDALIAASGKKTSTFLQLLKETAMRAGEASRLEWTNIDFERNTVTQNSPEKNSKPRIFKVSSKLIAMLNSLPKTSHRVFGDVSPATRKTVYYKGRKHIATKLQNPRLLKITFHTLRHWKASMLYHLTKDILYVKEFLGHRRIDATLLYVQLAETIFKETTNEFTVRVASSKEDITQLLEVGFEYICEKDGLLYFRKRK